MMQSRRYAFGGLLLVIALWPLVGSGQNGMSSGQWRAYSADEGSTRYSSLDQVTKENVKNLQVAWTWKFDNFGTPAETVTTETTPLMVNGVLYFTAGQRRSVVAAIVDAFSRRPVRRSVFFARALRKLRSSSRTFSMPRNT